MKVLYVCPWAHQPGHMAHFLLKESSALLKSGEQVSILTFCGILGGKEPKDIYHMTVVSAWYGSLINIVLRLLNWLNLKTLVAFIEQFITLLSAINLRKHLGCEVIYLREGEPFIFVPFVLDLFSKHKRWIISMIGIMMSISPGSTAYKFINASFWKPIYRHGLSRNRFVLLCENNYVEDYFKSGFMNGIFSANVELVRPAVEDIVEVVSKEDARCHLGIPENRIVILSFGALHGGKDIETVLLAIKEVSNVTLVHAGKITSNVNMDSLIREYGLHSMAIVHDCYISESDKQYYFAAADAVILSYKKDFLQATSMLWEAAGYKLPVIASDVGELGELVRNYRLGLVFTAGESSSFKSALLEFIKLDQDDRQKIKDNGEKFYADFSIDKWVKRFIDVSKQVSN